MRRRTLERLDKVYRTYKGYIGTKELLEAGFSNRQILFLTENRYLEKICHGKYWLIQDQYDKPFDYKCIEACICNPEMIICAESALFYQGILQKEPECLAVATARTDRSHLKMKFPIERHFFSDRNFKIGIQEKRTEFGTYKIYDIERSICDMIRLGKDVEIETLDQMKKMEMRYTRLLEYAKIFGIEHESSKLLRCTKNHNKLEKNSSI